MKVFAVIPAYNEEGTISEIIERTRKHVDQVVVVDDGSSDATYINAQDADILLRHPMNMNKGFSMITGIEIAIREGADVIVTIDADGQHEPAEIPRFLETLRDGGFDIVYGSRRFNENMPPVLRLGNFLLSGLVRAFYGVRINDTQSGFRVFTKEAYRKIKWNSHDYRVETEMLINATKNRLRHTELYIDTIYTCEYKGTTVIDGLRILCCILAGRFRR